MYERLRRCHGAKEQFEPLDIGVRLDVGVSNDAPGEKEFFVNEVGRVYGADYFSDMAFSEPHTQVRFEMGRAMARYFCSGKSS